MLATAMVLALGASAEVAVENETLVLENMELVWDDMMSLVLATNPDLLSGGFVVFEEAGLKMWVPERFTPVELSDEEKAMGLIAVYGTEEKDLSVTVTREDYEDMSLSDYKDGVAMTSGVEITDRVINGMPAISYEENEAATVALSVDGGDIVLVSFYTMTNEELSI